MIRILRPLALSLSVLGVSAAPAKPTFVVSEVEGPGSEIVFADLDGDGLKDAVLVDGLNYSVNYQVSKTGFARKPTLQGIFGERPCLVWPARMGTNTESLVVMTREGVEELCFTNRSGPPDRRQIIKRQTIIPDTMDDPSAKCFQFVSGSGTNWPLLFVPVAEGLEVWRYREDRPSSLSERNDGPVRWRREQLIEQAMETHVLPSVVRPGYTQSFALNMSVTDVNGDGRDDVMVMRHEIGGAQIYKLYLQNADGLFADTPSLVYTNTADWHTALHWVDINGDGRLDLVTSTYTNDPSFIPLLPSGKVFVRTYIADDQAQIPGAASQLYRKNDWMRTVPLVDVDGDGLVDMVLGYLPINTREGFRKAATAEQIDLNLKIYFCRPGGSFPNEADCRRDITLHFDHQMLFELDLSRLYSDRYVSLDGDFNGDGKKDLLMRESSKEISVYFFQSREKGFSQKPDLRFDCSEPMDSWEVKDLNGDGISDLVVKLWRQDKYRAFTSQRR